MKNTFVIQTDDEKFNETINEFLMKHCKENNVNAIIYELNQIGTNKVMALIKE